VLAARAFDLPAALELLRTYGTPAWADNLKAYLRSVETLKQRYARAREFKMVPVTLAEGQEVYLTLGDHSTLVKAIITPSIPPVRSTRRWYSAFASKPVSTSPAIRPRPKSYCERSRNVV